MGGEEALGHIKRIRPDVPVVICSGHNEVESIERFSRSDVDGILTKPYVVKQLVEKLKSALDKHALRHAAQSSEPQP
jgi:two-component system, cell cycle sensor histidine kinase and response regulator CckA